ncbi:WD repeat-containing protein 97 [Clinocottus analis]|uniref:WD repeat-containing protein 97 n=1 Tax=Clinocottus analis TaxID=304258 RepID=UPI0035C22F9E
MADPGEETRTTTVLFPGSTPRLSSQETVPSDGDPQNCFKQDVKPATGKVKRPKSPQHVLNHGLHRLQHFSCDSPVRCMMYSEDTAEFVSLHSDDSVGLYEADGHRRTPPARLPFMGLSATRIPGRLVGWGPGPVFTFLDGELWPLVAAPDALDVRACQAAEHSTELVTAGAGNVCLWSAMLMMCKVKIQKGMQRSTFTQMALAPPRSDRPHRAFVVCRRVVTVVDLDARKVVERKRDLCSCDITAMVFCSQLDCLIIASQDLAIRLWDPDWKIRVAFLGHTGVVSSLFYSSALSMLLSASADCTIRCWNVDNAEVVECVHTEQNTPVLCLGGTKKGDTFFSFSHKGVELWTSRTLYSLHCKRDGGAPLRQIRASLFPAPYPSRVLCLSGDSDITLVAAETGAVLTSFKAKQRIICADYCLQKEILVALTDTGAVLQANTLTNPITFMQEWEGIGQGPWTPMDNVTEKDAQNLPIPGSACCLTLYSHVVNAQETLAAWRRLQEKRGCCQRNKAALDDAKNKFLIFLGQSGGCLSVLKIDNGKVLSRMPAHNGQRVTAMQVYPENYCVLSTGEDMTVVVWKVNPYVPDCLRQQLSLHCGYPQVYLAALGPQLALTVQEPNTGTYNLMHFNFLNHSQTDCPPNEGHSDQFTGLCVSPILDVFVSSSLDGTVCIWNEKNHLIRTLQLNAVPECLAYTGFGGELFLGIKGDLYRMNCEEFLPDNYQEMLLYTYYVKPLPDMPIIKTKEKFVEEKNTNMDEDEEEPLPANARNVLLTEDLMRQKAYVSSVASSMDLAALRQGSIKCQKPKPPSTKETKKEAFDCYMKIIYGLRPIIKIDLDDLFDQDDFEIGSFKPQPYHSTFKKEIRPEPDGKLPVNVKEQKGKNVEEERASAERTPIKVKPGAVIPKKPIMEKKYEEPPEKKSTTEHPKPTTTPPPLPRRPPPHPKTPPPPREASHEVPTFLKQFVDASWFKDLYPDTKCIPSTLSPEDFSLQLLGGPDTSSVPMDIISALQDLHGQELLETTDELYQRLIDLVASFARPYLSNAEWATLVEILKLLVRLKPVGYELMKTLLALLAFKKLGLRETVMRILTKLSVNGAEQWLWPELESWESELQGQSDIWAGLHDRADAWLELWSDKYKEHNRYLYLRSTAKWKPTTVNVVDVLNYFCSTQEGEYRQAQCVPPARTKDTVLLSKFDRSSKPILRLGETYTSARVWIWRPPGIILPPMRNRPFLMHCSRFITFPLMRVSLSPFHVFTEEDWVRVLPTYRYFIQQQSCVEYYRRRLMVRGTHINTS